jgi:hypothetical protein
VFFGRRRGDNLVGDDNSEEDADGPADEIRTGREGDSHPREGDKAGDDQGTGKDHDCHHCEEINFVHIFTARKLLLA